MAGSNGELGIERVRVEGVVLVRRGGTWTEDKEERWREETRVYERIP